MPTIKIFFMSVPDIEGWTVETELVSPELAPWLVASAGWRMLMISFAIASLSSSPKWRFESISAPESLPSQTWPMQKFIRFQTMQSPQRKIASHSAHGSHSNLQQCCKSVSQVAMTCSCDIYLCACACIHPHSTHTIAARAPSFVFLFNLRLISD